MTSEEAAIVNRVELDGKTYVAKPIDIDGRTFATSCGGCSFDGPGLACKRGAPECRGTVRADGQYIIWVEEAAK